MAATRAYVRANYALVRTARANLATGQAALRGLARRTVAQCPGAAAGSPQNNAANELGDEIIGTMTLAVYHPDTRSIGVFVHAVRDLRWSNRRLTRIVHTYATKLQGLAALAPANICGDVQAWATGGFHALPESTVRFNRRYFAVSVEAEEVPLRLLAPYEGPTEASLLHRTKQLEAPLATAEAKAVENWTEIIEGLQLNP